MLSELVAQRDAIAELCRQFAVLRLAVFGSAATGDFEPGRSDVDFLVELATPNEISRFDAYFGLKEGLEALLGYPVDLVTPAALENPYFAESVERTCEDLYAA